MKVGLIGLGRMGAGMASSLLKAGHEVIVYNRSQDKTEPLKQQGAKVARTPAAASEAEAVFSIVADDAALAAVSFGQDGIIAGLPKQAVHLSSSTISVALSELLAKAHGEAGQRFVAAPVFGRPEAAAAARLYVVAAGDAKALADCAPLFQAIGQRSFIFGETPAMANIVKLSGNFLIGSVIESLGEAFALVGKSGVNLPDYLEMLTTTLFGAAVYKSYGAQIANGAFEPAGFTAPLGLKDVRLALEAAEKLNVPMPIGSLLRDRLLALIAQGGERLDWSAMGRLAAKDSGQSPGFPAATGG
jgi:3-hydroxyisobutyrate dehydrogenase-like beta-hydroxyacid dehydrogenase